MANVQFTVTDAELLYSIPKVPTDLMTIVRYFTFINRTAPPSYEELTGCLIKSISVGIVHEDHGTIVVEESWYERIHAADETAENEIESMLEFQSSFVNMKFPEVTITGFDLSHEDFQSIIKALT